MPERADATLSGLSVLVVEDEPLVAMEFTSVLERQGCSVLGPVPSVARALALIEKQRPDAAILDLNLNGTSTLPVLAMLNERNVPFVVVSGYGATSSDERELRQAPRLMKPVRESELLRALSQVLASPLR
jgi:CheY-like chemotaxis protein